MTGQAKTVTAARGRDQHQFGKHVDSFAQLRRQHRHDDIHSDLASLPGDGAAAGEHAADHEEEHDLLGPWDRNAEEVAADDVGEIDRDAG